jgi:hypothetical protein
LEFKLVSCFNSGVAKSGPEISARTLVREDTFGAFFTVSKDLLRGSVELLFLGGESWLRMPLGYDYAAPIDND